MSGRTGWLPPLEEVQQDAQETLRREQTSPRRGIRLETDQSTPLRRPSRTFPSLQRRESLQAYDPIIVKFLKNGDKFFEGVRMNITQKTMRNWDTLLAELSRRIDLPAGVRHIYTPERGHKVKSLSQLEHKKTYICGSSEPFRRMKYDSVKNPDWKTSNKIKTSDAGLFSNKGLPLTPFDPSASLGASMRSGLNPSASMRSWTENRLDLSARQRRSSRRQKPSHLNSLSEPQEVSLQSLQHSRSRRVRIQSPPTLPSVSSHLVLTVIKNTPPPRQRTSVYINRNSINSWEEVKLLIGENLKTVNGCLRLFSLEGEEVQSLSQLWRAGNTLIAAGNEKFDIVDFLTGAGKNDELPPHGLPGAKELSPDTTLTTDRVPDVRPHLPDVRPHLHTESKCAQPEQQKEHNSAEKLEKLDQESEALVVESNSGPSMIAQEALFAGAAADYEGTVTGHEGPGAGPSKETSSAELNTSSDIDQAAKELPGEKTKEKRQKTEVQFLSDSSGDAASISPQHQTFQESPLSSAYPLFPPTPTSDTPRPRQTRLSSMFEGVIRPMSLSSSPLESPLLRASKKSSLHKGFQAGASLQPQTPLSEISVGVIPSVVDMILLDREKTFPQSDGSTDSNFCLSSCSQPVKSRNVAIQTTYVDDHLSTIVEPEVTILSSEQDRLQLNSRENMLDEMDNTAHELEASSEAASQFYKHTKDKYCIGMVIAEGNFAAIKLCSEKEENKEFLLRVIQKAKVFGKDDKVLQEITIMRMIRHENVLTVQDYWESMDEVCMVMESIEGGDLFDAILYCQHFSEGDAMETIRQLGLALVYLHANSIVHRGVKPENIFLSLEMDGSWTLKLAGFSLATKTSEPLTLVCGNEYYRAPEMITEQGYGTKADVWSAGIVAYILLSGIMPFRRKKKSHTSKLLFPNIYWEDISSDAKDLICQLLVISPQERYSSSHLMQHCWLKKSFHGGPELSKKLIEYLTEKAAMKVAPVPILTVTALDHESQGKKNNRNRKTNQN